MLTTRRHILQALGIGAAGLILEEPIRKMWFVPSSAPVGSRIEQPACRGSVFASFDKAFGEAVRYEGEPVWRIEDIQATSNFAMDPDLEFTEEENAEIRRLAAKMDATSYPYNHLDASVFVAPNQAAEQLRSTLEAAVRNYKFETDERGLTRVSWINDLDFSSKVKS